MITLNFTLYRFVCDVTTFTGLFTPDTAGHCIKDTSSFACCWSRADRARTSGNHPNSCGATPMVFFKSQGSDMALNFQSTTGTLELDSENDVIVFLVRPSEFTGGVAPVVAKGTLDPQPYIGKQSKNYAIKLRDAAGQVIGKLLFALHVRDADDDRSAAIAASNSAQREKSEVRPARPTRRSASPTPPPEVESVRKTIQVRLQELKSKQQLFQQAERVSHSPPAPSTAPTRCGSLSPHVDTAASPLAEAEAENASEYLDLIMEKILVKSEAIDLDNPAPLLLGGAYCLKVRFGGAHASTPASTCQDPKEVTLNHRVSFAMPAERGEKLRFSLWEDGRQVGGFSLDPAKFRVAAGALKEYSIPFRYYPTQQSASLEVTVRRAKAGAPPPQPAQREPSAREYVQRRFRDTALRQSHWSGARGEVPNASTRRPSPERRAKDSTPLRERPRASAPAHTHAVLWGDENTAREAETNAPTSATRGPSPWRRHSSQNGAASGGRDEPLAESVLARLEARQGYRTSLMEEWLTWRGSRANTHSAPTRTAVPASGRASRADSVRSAFSRDESVDSIASLNRAASPLPTKSFAGAAEQRPFQPAYTHRSSSLGPGKPPLPMR